MNSVAKFKTPISKIWSKIIDKVNESNGSFIICDEWKEMSNFQNWMNNQISQLLFIEEGYKISVDLYQWDYPVKIYSPQICTLLPATIANNLSKSQYLKTNNLPPGLNLLPDGKYNASIVIDGTKITLGRFINPVDAFLSYKKAKEDYLKELANRYYNIGALKLNDYQALYNLQIKSTVFVDEINLAIQSGRIEELFNQKQSKPINPFIVDDYGKFYIGTIFRHSNGSLIQIVDYRSKFDVDVLFLDSTNYLAKGVNLDNVKSGNIKNPLYILKNGGYFGIGPYNTGKNLDIYKVWDGILVRTLKQNNNRKAYENCSVAEEWRNFQNFAYWYDNYRSQLNSNFKYDVDKDIFQWNREYKIYSPQTCCLVPHELNLILVNLQNNCRNFHPDLPLSVMPNSNKFSSYIGDKNERIYLGNYDSPMEAFNVYKKEKETKIKELAKYYYD